MPPRINSRYFVSKGKVDSNGTVYLEERKPFDYDSILTGDELTHTVEEGETLHQIAHKYWKGIKDSNGEEISEHLFWILGELNGIYDMTVDLVKGKELIVLTARTVREKVLNK